MSEKDLSYNEALVSKVKREAGQSSRAEANKWFDSQPKLTTEELAEGKAELKELIYDEIVEDMSKRHRPSDN